MRCNVAGALSAISFCLLLGFAPAAQAQPDLWSKIKFSAQAPAVDQPGRREWAWQGSNSFSYAGSGRVRYEPGGTPRIIVTGDPAEVANIEVDGGAVRRRETPGFNFTRGNPKLEILVQGVTLNQFDLAGSATMDLGRLQRDTLDLRVHGSGTVNAQGQAGHLTLQVDGSGRANLDQLSAGAANITVTGSGSIVTGAIGEGAIIRVTGSGKVKAGDIGKNADIRVTGSGNVILGRAEDVNATLMGSPTVRLSSLPKQAAYSVMGSGKVLLVGPDGKTTELARMQREGRQARAPRPPRPPGERNTDPGNRN